MHTTMEEGSIKGLPHLHNYVSTIMKVKSFKVSISIFLHTREWDRKNFPRMLEYSFEWERSPCSNAARVNVRVVVVVCAVE